MPFTSVKVNVDIDIPYQQTFLLTPELQTNNTKAYLIPKYTVIQSPGT